MKIFRLLFVSFAILGMAGVASSAVSPGFSDDFESYSLGTLPGQGPWISDYNGDKIASPAVDDINIVAEGIGVGSHAMGFDTSPAAYGGAYHGAGIEITGADSGVIDVNFLLFNSGRKHITLNGDGTQGSGSSDNNVISMMIYQHYNLEAPVAPNSSYSYFNWAVNGWIDTPEQYSVGWTDAGYTPVKLMARDLHEMNFRLDFDNDRLEMRYRDVDDTTGESAGAWVDIITSADAVQLPFTSLTYFGISRSWGPYDCDFPAEFNTDEGFLDNFSISGSALPGDFDADNDVDGADFGLWQTGYPTASGAALSDGDADGDGDVDGTDFGIWQANYPTNVGGAAAIPEPATLSLLLIGGVALLKRRRQ